MFPDLKVLPRPEPESAAQEAHDAWQQEYEQWQRLRCGCGRGYFCREHGTWISGPEVGSEVAVTWEQQQRGSCPEYHYRGYENIPTYVGQRDGLSPENPKA
ncbi:hypothetical protein NKR19_g9228 [Coniochaeta hoffmannii]|uniref:Uncharacterized protein n=1 Tax=Coniochaeta hoffmannii TaxID=91930 RepID=A0AA38RIC8_9PEZI|nr:hypothetical protein NKR19_g9228 [Coniochaeta hoffmannii]